MHARSQRDEGVFSWGREKFLEEAKTLARFRHPNIVRVARLFEANNTAYMVLDFEEGPSLGRMAGQPGRPPPQSELDRIANALLNAVEAVHEAGILHRDIKPANIIMRDGHDPVLIDFGAARQALSARSKTVHAIVTPGYSPKEQYALDVDRQGAWSDIYALGATFYYLVTGTPPADALSRDLEAAMPMATEGRNAYRMSFIEAIDAAMQVRAEDRPQSIAEWRQMLLGNAPVGAPGRTARPAVTGSKVAAPAASVRAAPAASRRPPATGAPRAIGFDDIRPATPQASAAAAQTSGGSLGIGAIASIIGALLIAAGTWYYVLVFAPGRDDAVWRTAAAANTIAAYDSYITRHPSGRHLSEARERRAQLVANPGQQPASNPRAGEPPSRQGTLQLPPSLDPQPPPTRLTVTSTPVTPPPPPDTVTEPVAPTGRAAATLAERRILPAALAQGELESLRQSVPAAQWRMAIAVFTSNRFRGFSEQSGGFIQQLEQLSGGKIKINILAGTEAPRSSDVLREVRNGADLVGWHSPILSFSRRPTYAIFAGGVPFGLPPADHARWLRNEGAHLLEQLYWRDNFHVRVIPCGMAAATGGWLRREIRAPGDLRGLKVRGTPLAEETLRKLGATPVALENNAIGSAFTSQTLDAVFQAAPPLTIFLKSPPPAPVFHQSGWSHPSYLFELIVSASLWQSMPDGQRRLLDEACRRNVDRWVVEFATAQSETVTQIRANTGITVRPFTGPVIEELRKAASEVLAEESARNPEFRDVLASYNRFRRQ